MICVAVTYVVKPGNEEEAAELFRKMTGHTRTEPGCRFYLAHRSTADPRRFFLYEQYDDQAALDAHRARLTSNNTSSKACSRSSRAAHRSSTNR